MGANDVLAIAQALYETHKATTYPRTDCGFLPTSMQQEIPDVLAAVAKSDPAVAPVLNQLDRQFVSRVWNDKKITAHHAIIPTRQAFDLSRLSADEQKVYHLIRQHYFAQFLPLQESDDGGLFQYRWTAVPYTRESRCGDGLEVIVRAEKMTMKRTSTVTAWRCRLVKGIFALSPVLRLRI